MKDKQKSLKDIDVVTELTMSELEGINGGVSNSFTSPQDIDPNGRSTSSFSPTPEPPPPEGNWNKVKPQNPSDLSGN